MPLVSTIATRLPDAADAAGRRKRRKKRHKHQQGGKKGKHKCTPEPVTVTCAGRCGIVPNNCGNPIECGCPVCQSCSGGVCTTDPGQNRAVCAGSGSTTSICCNGVCCDGCCGADGSCGACLVFVSSSQHTGNLGGLAGADAICQTRATNRMAPLPPLPGTYKAWLSTGTGADESPATGRIRQSGQPYLRVDGALIAANWADLLTPPLANPIQVTENLDTVIPSSVWTNTEPNGTELQFPADCGDWLNGSSGTAGAGVTFQTDANWTNGAAAQCNLAASRLYCFQQT